MLPYNLYLFFVFVAIDVPSLKCGDVVHLSASESADKLEAVPSLSTAAVSSPVLAVDTGFSFSLLSSFPEDLEVSDYCSDLLHIFGQRYVAYVNCLVPAARPVKVCQSCYSTYGSVVEIYKNISSDQVWAKAIFCVFLCYGKMSPVFVWRQASSRASDTSLVMWWVFAGDTFEETSLILATSFADLLRWNGNTHAVPVQAEGNSWGPFQMPLSPQMGPGNVTCRDSLLRSDRLMLVYQLYSNLESLWEDSNCARKSSSEV